MLIAIGLGIFTVIVFFVNSFILYALWKFIAKQSTIPKSIRIYLYILLAIGMVCNIGTCIIYFAKCISFM